MNRSIQRALPSTFARQLSRPPRFVRRSQRGAGLLRLVLSIGVFALVAVGAHALSLWAVPRGILHRMVTQVVPAVDTVVSPRLADAQWRSVVMPSPDLLYALCRVRLKAQGSGGAAPVEEAVIEAAPASRDYWSIALYDMNSDNFFVLNDRQAQGQRVRLRIATRHAGGERDEQRILAPGEEVLVIMRLLVRDSKAETLAQLEKDRATLRCMSAGNSPPSSAMATDVGGRGDLSGATDKEQVAPAQPGVDAASLALAERGFIARPSGQVRDEQGRVIWDYDSFDFLRGAAPDTVNASLWRQALLNNRTGLFKVTEGIWQLRGFDLANMTLIRGKSGWIVVDPLTTRETAQAAFAFARRHLGDHPVSAVIFTHSHVDHFGGVLGVVNEADVASGRIPVVAPVGFMEEATSENVMVGMAMARRSAFMCGSHLKRDPKGLVDNGLGKAVAYGHFGILQPTRLIEQPTETLNIDGVRFVFHNVPGSEAPAEFVFHLPDLRAFCGAELFAQTLHNIYTLRGAKVRDALKWSRYMDDMQVYAQGSDVLFNQHNWPVWGREAIVEHIRLQRDVYRYLHDQTVRLMNQGYTASEIAEQMRLPPELDAHLGTRGYYGTVRHNVKGIYQFYLGWYDGHPANLNPLPPVEVARRYVELAGGRDAAVQALQKAHQQRDHRWVAELGKHVVYAFPDHSQARQILADSLEQLGFDAEAATWRNVYLTGAKELREGAPQSGVDRRNFLDLLQRTPLERFFESMAAALNPERSAGVNLRINFVFTDTGERYSLEVKRQILNHTRVEQLPAADATLKLTRAFFLDMLLGEAGGVRLLTSSQTSIEGSAVKLAQFFRLLDKPEGQFVIMSRPPAQAASTR